MRKSFWGAVALSAVLGLATSACTTSQATKAATTLAAVCQSAPVAGALLATAVKNKDQATVNAIVSTVTATCPGLLDAVQSYAATVAVQGGSLAGSRGGTSAHVNSN